MTIPRHAIRHKKSKAELNAYWKNMPKNLAQDIATYWASKKLMWHKKEIGLTKSEVKELTETQKMIHKYHPEFDYILMLKDKPLTSKDAEFIGKQLDMIKYVESKVPASQLKRVKKYMKGKDFAKYIERWPSVDKEAALIYIENKLNIR